MRLSLLEDDPGFHPNALHIGGTLQIFIDGKRADQQGIYVLTVDTDTNEVTHYADPDRPWHDHSDELNYVTTRFDSVEVRGIPQRLEKRP